MEAQSNARSSGRVRLLVVLLAAMLLGLVGAAPAFAAPLTIKVVRVAANGTQTDITNTADYRWTVEEDATKASVPGQAATSANYSFSFHTSYMPVVAAGRKVNGALPAAPATTDPDVLRLYSRSPDQLNLDPGKRYYVSIAAVGHQMGGAPVVFDASGASATVYVNEYELPTAQISIFAFEDNNPINGAPDLPQETGLAGFTVQLLEAGGTYGQSGGAVTQDAFGNPLGTTYLPNGDVDVRGSGIVLTGPDGTATIKNLFPAKYTIVIVPPVGSDWHQTSTIEGTRGIDAWVKNNEPSFFQEFGPPGHHVFVGFTRSGFIALGANNEPVLNGSNTLTGRIVNTHHSRPPIYTFYNAAPVAECWVGLNEVNGGRALYAAPCKKDSTFSIPKVPNGTYELAIWDDPLDMIIAATTITVDGTKNNLGDLPVSSWFGRYQGRVFQDIDGTGLPFFTANFDRPYIVVDPVTGIETESTKKYKAGDLKPPFGEGIASNIRFRDGSIYQSTTTKKDGTFAFTEVFPFFNWMIAEIDYARFKATGATVVVDDGGAVDPGANRQKLWLAEKGLFGSNDPALAYDPWTRLNPQAQPDNGGAAYRSEQGVILLEGMQTFLGATNHIEWGKQPYSFNENGGIAGIVHYAITRAEDDPRFAAAENWEPGIPRVQVNLFLDCDGDGKPDKPNNDGSGTCASLSGADGYVYDQPDIDNYPFCWRDPKSCGKCSTVDGVETCTPEKGPEDIKRSGTGGASTFSYGDVFRWGGQTTPDQQPHWGLGKTDSWDDSIPTDCPSVTPYSVPSTGEKLDCYDGLRNYNQVRPSVFDGGYAFGRVAGQAELPMFIGTQGQGTYIVEAVAPPGYLHQGNGDKNVVFGDSLKASSAALPFECVGMELDVPATLTLFPGEANPNYAPVNGLPNKWRKCDMKAVPLVPGTNPAPDFYMFTEAPVAGHGVGFILDDTATEFSYLAPTFGEKYSPPHLPVSVQDWTGREITRVYSDQFGSYNFLVPSSFTINPPYPSGVMPSMMVSCMNHPGPIADPSQPRYLADGVTPNPRYGQLVIDPYYNRAYTTFCYTLQYLPGKTTYLDTPVLPVSAFASVDKNPLDCECADGTPGIFSVNNGTDNGPWVAEPIPVVNPTPDRKLTIVSQGQVDVVNPAFDPTVQLKASCPTTPVDPLCTIDPNDTRLKKNIKRDYGFGDTRGSGAISLGGTPLVINSWSADIITATVPAGAATGQLTIRRDNGKESVVGLTVHVGGPAPIKVNPNATAGSGVFKTIQEAIESVGDADMLLGALGKTLITVAPGTYNEYVIMDKRVRLQGWGAGSVTVNAAKSSTAGLAEWRARINAKANNTFTLLPGQTLGIDAANNEPLLFGAEEAPGVLVVGRQGLTTDTGLASDCLLGLAAELAIDGLTVTGSDSGGGILASGYACGLKVSNNRIVGNYGTYGGGIRVGHTVLVAGDNTPTDAVNRQASIHHNWISQNGATEAGGGGGVTLGTGSDGYSVANNYVCGNFSMADGGGLSHLGRSPQHSITVGSTTLSTPQNRIVGNRFVFNQTFNQAADPMGGGMSIAGQIPVGGGASEGTGPVVVDANLLQGNQAGAGAGGGISITRTAAADAIALTNNLIVNNVTAYAGGGVVLAGNASTAMRVVNNTIASNVSTATNRQSFGPGGAAAPSLPRIAGLAVLDGTAPSLVNNILWANRSYVFSIAADGLSWGLYDPVAGQASYRDLGRVTGGSVAPVNSLLTSGGTNLNVVASPTNLFAAADDATLFVKPDTFASVTDPNQPLVLADTTVTLRSALTFDETGNFVNVIFSPLTLWNSAGAVRTDFHLKDGAVAVNSGQGIVAGNGVPSSDYDGQARPSGAGVDIGADEVQVPTPILVVAPQPLGFGVVSLNTTKTLAVTVSNGAGATANLVLAAASITNGNVTGRYSVANVDCPIGGLGLAAGQSCTLNVSFAPTSTSPSPQTSTLNVNASNATATAVALSGNVVTPTYTITPALAHNFGGQQVGASSAPVQFTLTNTALSLGGELWLTGTPTLSGTNAGQFQAAFRAGDTCTATTKLATGASCTFSVVFAPTSTGCKGTAILGVCVGANTTVNVPKASGNGNSPGVFGTGTAPAPALACPSGCANAGSTYGFGAVAASASATFTLSNTGATAAPFVIGSVSVAKTGAGAGNYTRPAGAAGGTCAAGNTLAVGSTCTVIVLFSSPTSSTTTGTVTVTGTGQGVGAPSYSVTRNLTGS